MVSEKYLFMPRELLKKLCKIKDKLDLNCVDFSEPFPYDQFIKKNKEVRSIVKELEDEFDYEMSEFQCSWAIFSLIKGECESDITHND